ncbi:MAG: molybdenum cofactor guanylyltransferase MobA [Gallionellaceae bacterium]|jgi:molybdenum cofactor guanylyltransferase
MNTNQISVATVILAGGWGVRIGGNKGLRTLQGRPLVAWLYDAVSRDSVEVLISANDATEDYSRFGIRIIADLIPGRAGPLAGLHAAFIHTETEFVMTVPCDTPFLPQNLLASLCAGFDQPQVEAVVAVAGGYRQPTIALYRKNVLPKLVAFLDSGGRRVSTWLDTLRLKEVGFENADYFENINNVEELARAEQFVIQHNL